MRLSLPVPARATCLTKIIHRPEPDMARSSVNAPKEPASYEQALAELDLLVQRMEAGQLPLDQLLDSYRRGTDLLVWCRSRLQAVEEQVKLLDDGQLKTWSAA
jgi:exodeoxyribonuclease VII small subunit